MPFTNLFLPLGRRSSEVSSASFPARAQSDVGFEPHGSLFGFAVPQCEQLAESFSREDLRDAGAHPPRGSRVGFARHGQRSVSDDLHSRPHGCHAEPGGPHRRTTAERAAHRRAVQLCARPYRPPHLPSTRRVHPPSPGEFLLARGEGEGAAIVRIAFLAG